MCDEHKEEPTKGSLLDLAMKEKKKWDFWVKNNNFSLNVKCKTSVYRGGFRTSEGGPNSKGDPNPLFSLMLPKTA